MRAYDLLNRAAGWIECRVTGALPAAFLNRCADAGVLLYESAPEGDYALRVRLRSRDLPKAQAEAVRAQCTLEPVRAGGVTNQLRRLMRRIPIAAALLLAVLLLAWSKLYIWDIEVTGNETVPTGRILDALRECGVDRGTFWPGITSDLLRNRLLTELPELAWVTVNVYGSRAETVVRERVEKPELWRETEPFDLVSDKTAFITKVMTMNGTARVRAGSAVTAGEVLISGVAESAWGGTRLVHATGIVRGETYYELSAAAPLTEQVKTYTGDRRIRWAVIIGKNRYNFYGDSSISQGDCDRISDVWNLAAEGIFSLPVQVVRETERDYTLTERPRDLSSARRTLEETLRQRLDAELGEDGTVENIAFSASESKGMLFVTLRARCSENIGVEKRLAQSDG